ncbi:MAG TPA: IPT/TIG domain-containing protein [Ferruginibacter sp.]|jgi:hypothetical protein|nr:IPT/TIG domain-containing protein [Ferruginibacter sp.]
MKQIKNATLAVLGGLLILSVATVSCSKKSGGSSSAPAPTVSTITPATDTIGQVITITGTNFAGATVTVGGVTATNIGIAATALTATIPTGVDTGSAVIVKVTTAGGSASGTIHLIASSSLFQTTDGKTSSNQVQAASLVGYWPFDADLNAHYNGTSVAPYSTSGTTITSGGTATLTTAGRIGGAVQLSGTNGGWLVYPANATAVGADNSGGNNNNDTLQHGFTVSLWAQLPVQTKYTSLFQLSGVSNCNTWPLAGFGFHKNTSGSTTKIDIDGGATNVDGVAPYVHSTNGNAFSNSATNGVGVVTDSLSWVFLSMTYDTTGGGKLVYYGNGAFLGSVAIGVGAPATGAGPVSIFPQVESLLQQTPNYATIGALTSLYPFPNVGTGIGNGPITGGWGSIGLTGTIDDVRLFNKTLSATDISDLFLLGSHGQ